MIDSDRILVLSSGKVSHPISTLASSLLTAIQIVEFDTPDVLLANPTGIFTGMAAEAGVHKGVIE